MIGLLSKVNIIDNSGGLEGKCIKILYPKSTKSGRKIRTAQTGDLILISLTKSLPVSHTTLTPTLFGRGNIYKALIVRTKKESNKYLKNINHDNLSSTNPAIVLENGASNIIKKGDNQFKYLNSRLSFNSKNLSTDLPASRLINERVLKMDTVKNSYDDNSVVLVKVNPNSLDFTPLGTRIKGPICKKLKNRKGCTKIVSILT
jgi:ribosomal protein L14